MEKRDLEEKESAARWFLNFISEDLDALPEPKFLRLVAEADFYFTWVYRELFKSLGPSPPREKIEIPKGVPQKSIEESMREWDHPLKRQIREIQPKLRESFESWINLLQEPEGRAIIAQKGMNLWFLIADGKFKAQPMPDGEFDLQGRIRGARISFAYSLDGMPKAAIRTCQECGKYFSASIKKAKILL